MMKKDLSQPEEVDKGGVRGYIFSPNLTLITMSNPENPSRALNWEEALPRCLEIELEEVISVEGIPVKVESGADGTVVFTVFGHTRFQFNLSQDRKLTVKDLSLPPEEQIISTPGEQNPAPYGENRGLSSTYISIMSKSSAIVERALELAYEQHLNRKATKALYKDSARIKTALDSLSETSSPRVDAAKESLESQLEALVGQVGDKIKATLKYDDRATAEAKQKAVMRG